MKNNHPKIFIWSILVLFAVMTGAMLLPLSSQLCVRNQDNSDLLLHFSVNPGDQFEISYIHSQNRGNVRDFFRIDQEYRIILKSTCFSSYGAGMPEPEGSQLFRYDREGIWIENIDRMVNPYIFFVGTIANHHFHWVNAEKKEPNTYAMKELAPPGTSIIVQVEKFSGFALIFTELE
jgi:hypothetical protein